MQQYSEDRSDLKLNFAKTNATYHKFCSVEDEPEIDLAATARLQMISVAAKDAATAVSLVSIQLFLCLVS